MKNTLLQFKNVSLGYKNNTLLTSLNFEILKGDYLGIVGPNGVGKSTLLKAILGIHKQKYGDIFFNDQEDRINSQLKFGYVPQRGQLDEVYPLTVEEIVIMGRYRQIGILGKVKRIDKDKTLEALMHLDIYDLTQKQYSELSGGQKQRALIARALVSDPDILILDEPTDGLDVNSQNAIMKLITHFHQEHKLTIMLVSHHLSVVVNHANRIALIEKGVFQIGEVDEILNQKNLKKLYNMPIEIKNINGEKIILTGQTND